MRDPELVARAQHAAARLETAWERWRALQGVGEGPAQPVVGYVGYALKEPWGQPRAVIGFSADEAERLADFLEHNNSEPRPATLPATAAQPPAPSFTPARQSAGTSARKPVGRKPEGRKPEGKPSQPPPLADLGAERSLGRLH